MLARKVRAKRGEVGWNQLFIGCGCVSLSVTLALRGVPGECVSQALASGRPPGRYLNGICALQECRALRCSGCRSLQPWRLGLAAAKGGKIAEPLWLEIRPGWQAQARKGGKTTAVCCAALIHSHD